MKTEMNEILEQMIWPRYCMRFQNYDTGIKYWIDIQELSEYTGKSFIELKLEDVDKFYQYLKKKTEIGTLANSTMAKKFHVYHSFATYLEENHKEFGISVYQNHFHHYLPKLTKMEKIARSIPIEAIDQLFIEAQKDSIMHYCILTLLYRGCLTSKEICMMRGQDITVYENAVYVSVYKRELPVYLSEDIWEVLNLYLKHIEIGQQGYLFVTGKGNPLYPMYISRMMKEYCKKAGINGYSAESLRNAGAMSMFAYGVNEKDAAQRMGITTSHIKRYKNGAYRDNILQAADHMVKIRVDVPDQWRI